MSTALLLVAWSGIIWGFLSVVVFVLCLLLTLIILIQDSKDTGLTSAFGGVGGGNALLGARMQKDLAKLTAIFGGVLAVCLIIMGLMTTSMRHGSVGSAGTAVPPTPEKVQAEAEDATKAPELPGGATSTSPGVTPPSGEKAQPAGTAAPVQGGATGQPAPAAPAPEPPKAPAPAEGSSAPAGGSSGQVPAGPAPGALPGSAPQGSPAGESK
jgi:protein translocase SecG subunit